MIHKQQEEVTIGTYEDLLEYYKDIKPIGQDFEKEFLSEQKPGFKFQLGSLTIKEQLDNNVKNKLLYALVFYCKLLDISKDNTNITMTSDLIKIISQERKELAESLLPKEVKL